MKKIFKERKEIYENLNDLLEKISEGSEIDIKDLQE